MYTRLPFRRNSFLAWHREARMMVPPAVLPVLKTLARELVSQDRILLNHLKRRPEVITIGESLRWDGRRYWLTFSTHETVRGVDHLTPAKVKVV